MKLKNKMTFALEGQGEDPSGACGYKRGVAGPNLIKKNGGRFKLTKLSSYMSQPTVLHRRNHKYISTKSKYFNRALQWLHAEHCQLQKI